MDSIARALVQRPRAVLLACAVLSGLAALPLPLAYDDDVVRFLPQQDPEVKAFDEIVARFGSLDVALVGVESADLFRADTLGYIRTLTQRLRTLAAVEHVASLTELAIVQASADGGADHVALVPPDIPTAPMGLAAIRARVMSQDYLVGSVISADAGAALLIVRLRRVQADGAPLSSKQAAESVRAAADAIAAPQGVRLHYGGAPFIAEAAANGSQEDLKRLAPFVIGIILLLVIVSLGSLRAALLTVATVGLGILWTLGIIGWLGEPLTLVSTSLPVLLVALGSAYAVHVLVWYREHQANVVSTLRHMGPPVVVTALTTAAGFLSFLVMDLAPMREFGWQMALGSIVCAGLALTFIPCALSVWPVAPRATEESAVDRWLVRSATRLQAWRWPVLGLAAAVAFGFSLRLDKIDTRMDTAGFFEHDSAPAQADRFLADRFGGSVFLQVLVDGDVRDPAVLHRMAAFEDRLAGVDGVTRIESFSRVIAVVHEGLKGARRPSRERAEIEQLGFLARRTDPIVDLLVEPTWKGALIQVGIGGFDTDVVERLTREVRRLAALHLDGGAVSVTASAARRDAMISDASERIAAVAGAPGVKPAAIAETLRAPVEPATKAQVHKAIHQVLQRELIEDEWITLSDEDSLDALVATVTTEVLASRLSKDRFVALMRATADPSETTDAAGFERLARVLFTLVEGAATPARLRPVMARLEPHLAAKGVGARHRVTAIVDELQQPIWYATATADAPGAAPLKATVSGQPVIQQAMTRSVQRNQSLSLLVGLPLVLLIMCIVFRSVIGGVIGILPAGLTLLTTFGLMGLFPEALPMDLGSSMLASIALGVGIDYAIHFLWRYERGGLEAAMRTTGRAIAINAAQITGGFVVLAFATIAPMSRFGLLTAETLLVAAFATLTLLPPLLTWWKRGPAATPVAVDEPLLTVRADADA